MIAFLLPLLAALPTLAAAGSPPPAARPNIIFLLTDDQRDNTLGAMGHPFAQTPNLDRLMRNSVRFRNTYIAQPVCAPSRVSVFTGMHERLHGVGFSSSYAAPLHGLTRSRRTSPVKQSLSSLRSVCGGTEHQHHDVATLLRAIALDAVIAWRKMLLGWINLLNGIRLAFTHRVNLLALGYRVHASLQHLLRWLPIRSTEEIRLMRLTARAAASVPASDDPASFAPVPFSNVISGNRAR